MRVKNRIFEAGVRRILWEVFGGRFDDAKYIFSESHDQACSYFDEGGKMGDVVGSRHIFLWILTQYHQQRVIPSPRIWSRLQISTKPHIIFPEMTNNKRK